jgi:hypothetical protein
MRRASDLISSTDRSSIPAIRTDFKYGPADRLPLDAISSRQNSNAARMVPSSRSLNMATHLHFQFGDSGKNRIVWSLDSSE